MVSNIKSIEKIAEGNILLTVNSSTKSMEQMAVILKYLVNARGMKCIYVTSNKPFKILKKFYKSKGVNTKNLHFIDCITRLSKDLDFEEGVMYLDLPTQFDYLDKFINTCHEIYSCDFVIVDSISTFLIYSPLNVVRGFFHSISNKMKLVSVGGDFILLGKPKKEVLDKFRMFVDEVVYLKEGIK